MPKRARRVLSNIGQAVLVGGTTIALAFGVAALVGDAREEQTRDNVERLVHEAHLNREVLCIAILENTNNTARTDPRLVALCADVDVTEGGTP